MILLNEHILRVVNSLASLLLILQCFQCINLWRCGLVSHNNSEMTLKAIHSYTKIVLSRANIWFEIYLKIGKYMQPFHLSTINPILSVIYVKMYLSIKFNGIFHNRLFITQKMKFKSFLSKHIFSVVYFIDPISITLLPSISTKSLIIIKGNK